MPPQTAIREISGSSIARRIAATIAAGWSPTTSMWTTGRPAPNARRASRLELVSCVWPLRISSPTVTIAVRPVAFGTGFSIGVGVREDRPGTMRRPRGGADQSRPGTHSLPSGALSACRPSIAPSCCPSARPELLALLYAVYLIFWVLRQPRGQRPDEGDRQGDPGRRPGVPQPAVHDHRRDRGGHLPVPHLHARVEDRCPLPDRRGAERRRRVRGHEHLGALQPAHRRGGPRRDQPRSPARVQGRRGHRLLRGRLRAHRRRPRLRSVPGLQCAGRASPSAHH